MNIINSMIVSNNLQEELIAWKKKHGIKGDNEGKLGAHYWVNFKKRHPEINSKRAVRFDSKRDDWCTIENFEKMYKGVYAAMVDAKVAIQLEEEVFVKPDGTITEKEEESVGRKTKFLLTRPEYCLYVDEVGCNTSQKSDGNVGGQKFVVGTNQRALISASHQDCHFTVLGFTNALGEAVCCVIILAASEVRAKDVMGLQPWVTTQIGNVTTNLEENSHGPEKYYPYGPTCHVNGKVVETLVTCSESGSITSEILTQVLTHLDTHLCWDRVEATPFLLLDGHGSRFELPFLNYIRSEETKWKVCIGVPYGTNLWQVGDSAQQNGAFKSKLSEEKAKLLERKQEMRLPFRIERHDAVGLTHRAWNHSFARVDSNKKAVVERGWGPLTYNLLDNEELTRKKDNKAVSSAYQLALLHGKENVDPSILKFDAGTSKTVMDRIVESKIRDRALNRARTEQVEAIQMQRMEVFHTCMRMTAGVAFNAGVVDLSDGRIHERVLEQTRNREQAELQAIEKRKQQYENAKNKVNAIREKSSDPNK